MRSHQNHFLLALLASLLLFLPITSNSQSSISTNWQEAWQIDQTASYKLLPFLLETTPGNGNRIGRYDTFQIIGSVPFITRTQQTLKRIRDYSPKEYAVIQNSLRVIRNFPISGVAPYLSKPLFDVSTASANHSVTWYAGIIAHDAWHSWEYNHKNIQTPNNYTAMKAYEQRANIFQLKVMKNIGAPSHEIKHLQRQDGSHFDVNRDGKYDQSDYEQRGY